jgi:RNA polymerase sigma-70 factor (ECF subfamily)
VDAALARLPEEFRSVVVLVDVEELTYEEASTVLGCPVGTVRSRLSRGRRRLYLDLRDYARQQGFVKGGGA